MAGTMRNISSPTSTIRPPSPVNEYVLLILCVIIVIKGVIGNAVVIYIFGWKKRITRSRNELLLLLLAICDLFSCLILPEVIMERYGTKYKPRLAKDRINCWISELMSSYAITVSQVIIIIICIERYRKITSPMAPALTRRVIFLGILGGAVGAVVIKVPFMTSTDDFCEKVLRLQNGTYTQGNIRTAILVYMALLASRDFIALIIMAVLIHKMLKALKKLKCLPIQDSNGTRKRKYNSARKMIIAMIICFSICVIPHSTFQLILTAMLYNNFKCDISAFPKLHATTAYLKVLLAFSTALNPTIYSFLHPSRVAARKKLCSIISQTIERDKPSKEGNLVTLKGKQLSTSGSRATLSTL